MSSIAMMGASALESLLPSSTQTRVQKFKQQFQQLGQDLQSGNIQQAESDLAALQPGAAANASSSSKPGVVSQAFNQLAQDLQSGNLTAAQSDYSSLQQNLQKNSVVEHHHHAQSGAFNNGFTELQQTLNQLGQALQSGNLSTAQQAYTALQADAALFSSSNNGSGSGSSTGSGVNVLA